MVIRPLELCFFNVQKSYERSWIMYRRVEKTADAKLKKLCVCVCVRARARARAR